jgi:hypothetical protein
MCRAVRHREHFSAGLDCNHSDVRKLSLVLLALVAVGFGGCTSRDVVQTVSGGTAAERLLATSFSIKESDVSRSPVSSGNFELTMAGRRSESAVEATEHFTPSGSQHLNFTLYATKSVYCHLGSDLSTGGFCDRFDGYDRGITFESLAYLRSIASGKSVVTSRGRTLSFSGSAVSSSSTTGTVHQHWTGTLVIRDGLIANMQFKSSDSLGGVAHDAAAFTVDHGMPAISPPSGVEGHL